MKFWWPQTEAVIATLYAYLATGNEKYLDMHKQISDWTYAHFPDKSVENGLDISIVTARLHKWPRVTCSKARSTFQE